MEILNHVGGCRGRRMDRHHPRSEVIGQILGTDSHTVLPALARQFSYYCSALFLLISALTTSLSINRPVFRPLNQVLRKLQLSYSNHRLWVPIQALVDRQWGWRAAPPSLLLIPGLAGLLLLGVTGLVAPFLIWSGGAAPLWGPGRRASKFQPLLIWTGPRTLTPELVNDPAQHIISLFSVRTRNWVYSFFFCSACKHLIHCALCLWLTGFTSSQLRILSFTCHVSFMCALYPKIRKTTHWSTLLTNIRLVKNISTLTNLRVRWKSDSWHCCKLSITLQNPSRVQSVHYASKWNRFMVCFCSYHDDVTAWQIRKVVLMKYLWCRTSLSGYSNTHSLHFSTGSKPAICTYPSCVLYLPNLR